MICYTIYMMNNRGIIKAGEASAIESLVATLYCPICKKIITEMREDPRIDGSVLPFCGECLIYWKPNLKTVFLRDSLSYVIQVHLDFATELEDYWRVEKNEIHLDEADPKSTVTVRPPRQDLQPARHDSEDMFEPAPHLNADLIAERELNEIGSEVSSPPEGCVDTFASDLAGRDENTPLPLPSVDSNPQDSNPQNNKTDTDAEAPESRIKPKSPSIYELAKQFIDHHVRGEFTYAEIHEYVSKARGYTSGDGLYKQIGKLIGKGKIKRLQRDRYLRLK